MMLQSLITTADHVRRAAEHQAKLEAIMVEAGGIPGPGSIGSTIIEHDRNDQRRGYLMRQFFPVEDLARDERFVQTNMAERMQDARQPRLRDAPASGTGSSARAAPRRRD